MNGFTQQCTEVRTAPPIGMESIWGTPEVPAAAQSAIDTPTARCPHARIGCSAWEKGACHIGGCEAKNL